MYCAAVGIQIMPSPLKRIQFRYEFQALLDTTLIEVVSE